MLHGDAYKVLDTLEPNSIDCVFTSPNPPFYSKEGIGSETTERDYLYNLAYIFDKVRNTLKDTGSCFVHMGDYHDDKGNMRLIPERFAARMLFHDWILRSKLIWHRTEDRPVENKTRFRIDWEYIYFFTKTMNYYFNPVLCDSSVLSFDYIEPYRGEFVSGFPEEVIRNCIISACPQGGTVLDPFCGTGSTGVAALKRDRKFIGIELKAENIIRIRKRLAAV